MRIVIIIQRYSGRTDRAFLRPEMLGIVIVAYRNPELTADYILNQLPKLVNHYVVVVVNNASTMQECKELAARVGGVACEAGDFPEESSVYILNSDSNLGFAKGNNLGAEFLRRVAPCEHLLFSNNDIILQQKTDLGLLTDLLDKDSSIGAVGPAVVGLDGHHQSPHRRVVTAYRQIGWILLSRLRKKRKQESESTIALPTPLEGFCYWVSGCFLIMRADVFEKVGGFDPDTFLYSEEPILAERLKAIGRKMYYCPAVCVTHMEGGTTKETFNKPHIKRLLVESNCIYYRKYLHTPRPVVAMYKLLNTRRDARLVRPEDNHSKSV